MARRVFRSCFTALANRVTWVNLVELYMVDFNVIWEWICFMLVLLPLIVEQEKLSQFS